MESGSCDKRLSEADVYSVRRRYSSGEKLLALAAEYGVTQGAMSNIIRGLTYRSCTLVPPVPWEVRNDCRKLNAEQVKSIRMRYVAAQAEVRDMAVEFGVTKDAIRKSTAIRSSGFCRRADDVASEANYRSWPGFPLGLLYMVDRIS